MASGQYQNVNGVKTLNLHGKNYVEVAERVHMVHEKKAVFSIVKSEPVNVADRWLWVAVIVVDGQQYIGNAEIKMNAPKNTPDGTNPFECGETSAIGRALAFAGFGSVESIASKDEIERSKPYEATTNEPATPAARTQPTTKPAQETPTNNAQSDDLRPAGAAEQALERLAKECVNIAGEEKGPALYLRLYKYAREKFHVGSDTPDASTPDDVLTEMWTQVRKAKKQALAKAS